jgi:hypothetical protein
MPKSSVRPHIVQSNEMFIQRRCSLSLSLSLYIYIYIYGSASTIIIVITTFNFLKITVRVCNGHFHMQERNDIVTFVLKMLMKIRHKLE